MMTPFRHANYYCHCCDRRVDTMEVEGEHQCRACGDTFVERVEDADDLHRFLESSTEQPSDSSQEDAAATAASNRSNSSTSTGATRGAEFASGLDSFFLLSSLLERLEQRGGGGGGARAAMRARPAAGGSRTEQEMAERASEATAGNSFDASFARLLLASALGAQGQGTDAGGDGIDRNRLGDYYFGNMNDVLHQIFLRDGGAQGVPPASEEALESLGSQAVTISEEEAAECAAAAERAEAAAAVATDGDTAAAEGVSESDYMCPVCMDVYEAGQKAVRTRCGHRFHLDCISRWLQSHNTCPICRESVA